jgi:hypothetical protein
MGGPDRDKDAISAQPWLDKSNQFLYAAAAPGSPRETLQLYLAVKRQYHPNKATRTFRRAKREKQSKEIIKAIELL